jgi:hypothetical protein
MLVTRTGGTGLSTSPRTVCTRSADHTSRHTSRPERTREFWTGCVVTLDVSAPPPV